MSKPIRVAVEEVVAGWSQLKPSGLTEVLLEWFVIIPRNELPEVSEGPHEGYARTETIEGTFESAFYLSAPNAPASDPAWHTNRAMHHISMAAYLAEKKSEISEAKRNARRDELAREFSGLNDHKGYVQDSPILKAIDRIIDLEEAAA